MIARDNISWRRLLSYMCPHSCFPFLKHLSVVMINMFGSHFLNYDGQLHIHMFVLISHGKWWFLLVVHMMRWINDHDWVFFFFFGCYYTKHCIYAHIVFYVIMIYFLTTLFLNKFTNIVIPTYFFVHPDANHWDKVWYNLHHNRYVMKHCHGWLKLDENIFSTWQF